jgi:hypothetical protein
VGVASWQRAVLGALLVAAIAVAGIALNFTLLRLTQDAHDPVGKLSPRAAFPSKTQAGGTATSPAPTTPTTTTDDHEGDGDDDD